MKKANTIKPVRAFALRRSLHLRSAHTAKARVAPEAVIKLIKPPSSSINSSILMLSLLAAPSAQNRPLIFSNRYCTVLRGEKWLSITAPATMPAPKESNTRRVVIASSTASSGGMTE
ncbi:Uncharacterised protein [Vibrio cholerae]|uniref:Uncharacterized protein n=1 Tax=Vibrio cholerae TaxID=666 RepID=A0A655WWM9_VIBCL|nr:Uncharacterised protein [Vibrio cholerae]